MRGLVYSARAREVLRGLAWTVLFITACGGAPGDGGSTAEAQTSSRALKAEDAPAAELVNAYLAASAKLAADDFAGAHVAFERARTAVAAPALKIAPDMHKRIEQAVVAAAGARDLAAARTSLAPLTEALLAWFATQPNPLAETLGVARCPMAFSNKGAKWLQLGSALRNPYFGKEMLTCGSIDARVEPGRKL